MANDSDDEGGTFCLCGAPIDGDALTCGRPSCQTLYEQFYSKLERFFEVYNEGGTWEAFEVFLTLEPGVQAAILTNLPEQEFWGYLQALDPTDVLSIVRTPAPEFRQRFIQVLEPKAREAAREELGKEVDPEQTNDLTDYLLHLIDVVLTLAQSSQYTP